MSIMKDASSLILVAAIMAIWWCTVEGSSILVVDPIPAKTNHILTKAVADILHKRGHQITFITCFPSKNSSYLEVGTPELEEENKDFRGFIKYNTSSRLKFLGMVEMDKSIARFVDGTLKNANVQMLLKDNHVKFDLVIVDYFINEAFLGLGVKYDCPVMVLSTSAMLHWLARETGNPTSPAVIPNAFHGFFKPMTFKERLANTAMTIVQEVLGWTKMKKSQAMLYEKYFPEEAAEVDFYHLKISMVLLNTHPSLGVPRPLLPNTVEIGGYHIGETKPLPEELKKILDGAKNGAIYFSMGGDLKSSEMPENVRRDILRAFANLKQTVLWNFECDLPGRPKNVIIKKSMPQSSILAHPNVKIFISHGGPLSTTEAAFSGVPILTIPIFGDQRYSANVTAQRGHGLYLDYSNLTDTSLTWAIEEMLTNPKYESNAKQIYQQVNNSPTSSQNLISFFVEYVIKTGGAKHLTPPDINLFSGLLLDVALLLSIIPVLLVLIFVFLCKKYVIKIWEKHEDEPKKNKAKND